MLKICENVTSIELLQDSSESRDLVSRKFKMIIRIEVIG